MATVSFSPSTLFYGLLLGGVLSLLGCDQSPLDKGNSPEFPLPSLAVKGLQGGELQLSTLKEKVTILNVWAPWCPPCLEEMPSLERLSRTLAPSRYRVMGLTTDDRFLALEFLEKHDITFRNYFIEQAKLDTELKVTAFPETLIINQQGMVVKRILGFRDWESDEIRTMLAAVEARGKIY